MTIRNTIEALQMDVEIPDVVQQKANQSFDKIQGRQTDLQEEDKIIPYNPKQTRTVSRIPKKRMVVAAAVITLALATVTVAAAYLNWSKSLSEGLQATEEQKVHLEESNMTTFVGQSCTDQGITVTAVQSITDNYYTHLAFRVDGYQVEDGVQPDFENIDITVDGKDDFNYGASFYNGLITGNDGYVINADGSPLDMDENGGFIEHYVMEDGSLEYQITLSNSGEKGFFINKPIHVELRNLGTVSKAEYMGDIEGIWSFDWDLQGSDEQKEFTLNVPLGDSTATVVKASLSPISMQAEYEFPRQELTETGIDENGEEISYTTLAEPPYFTGVKLKDGTLHAFINDGGSLGYESEDSDLYKVNFGTDRIIDVDQVESLLFVKSYQENDEPVTEDNFYVVPIE